MERRVLLLYQPVFQPHMAIEPTTSATSPTPSLSSSPSRALGKSIAHSAPASPSHATSDLPPQGGSALLDAKHSRSVPALQAAGRSAAQLLADENVQLDLFSILPASYTRSTHPAFTSASGMSRSTTMSSAAHRTTSASSNESSSDSWTGHASRSRSHAHSHHNHHHHHGLFPGLTSLLHSLPGSRHASPGSSRPLSRRNSQNDSAHAAMQSHFDAHDALLQLTDVLRVEDEEAEEAREQLLDRLAILQGELDDGGERRSINVDVRQAADGESLHDALQRILRQARYDRVIMVNDAELEHFKAGSPDSADTTHVASPGKHAHAQHALAKRVAGGFARLQKQVRRRSHAAHSPQHELELEHDRVALAADADALRKDIQKGFGSALPVLAI